MSQRSARSWAETLAISRRGEAVLDAVFGPDFIIVKATRDHERQGIDRFFIHRTRGGARGKAAWKIVDARCAEIRTVAVDRPHPRDVNTWEEYEQLLRGRA